MPPVFEYAYIGWSSLTALTSQDLWDNWEQNREFRPLPEYQQKRHRRRDGVIYMGDGYRSVPYKQRAHEVLEFRPSWELYPAILLFG